MPVSIDNAILNTQQLGLATVGAVLDHVARQGRVAVSMTVDRAEPDYANTDALRAIATEGHLVQLETADPREMAMDALVAMESALGEADASKDKAADLLQRNQTQAALVQLSACLGVWQQAQQCVAQSAQLVGINLDEIRVDGEDLQAVVSRFAAQLREIRRALEDQDYVALGDVLNYELGETGRQWRSAIVSLSTAVAQAG
jgi:hypothetical protein